MFRSWFYRSRYFAARLFGAPPTPPTPPTSYLVVRLSSPELVVYLTSPELVVRLSGGAGVAAATAEEFTDDSGLLLTDDAGEVLVD
jgi:hypothetical protein